MPGSHVLETLEINFNFFWMNELINESINRVFPEQLTRR